MKKYLYIVLLVGVWSCDIDSTKEVADICDDTISDDAKAYADDNWNLQSWWNFYQSGPSVLQNNGFDEKEFQIHLRKFNSVLKLINSMNVNLKYIQLPYFLITENSNKYYTIEEKFDGDLFNIIAENPNYFNTDIKRFKIILNLLKCLEVLHSNNLCHLDIKPENFLVLKLDEENLQIKLTDFDFMEKIDDLPDIPMKGSINYIDPQVYHIMRRFLWDNQAVYNDLYGIGIIYYLLLYGKFPYNNQEEGFRALNSEKCSELSVSVYYSVDDSFEREFISYLCNPNLSKRKNTTELIQIIEDKLTSLGIPPGAKKTLIF